ncbi:hypothetical protein WN55_01720 [Dufourea novaeangliae]|uniref:Uncharacterized protein n=1 Tax=Dufourea novaeangliae TaxID=178035 RepID=A0A154PIK1_DUFNO|nr:hypothetical protein WN55_01720 [Dufourea novaeangliae]
MGNPAVNQTTRERVYDRLKIMKGNPWVRTIDNQSNFRWRVHEITVEAFFHVVTPSLLEGSLPRTDKNIKLFVAVFYPDSV